VLGSPTAWSASLFDWKSFASLTLPSVIDHRTAPRPSTATPLPLPRAHQRGGDEAFGIDLDHLLYGRLPFVPGIPQGLRELAKGGLALVDAAVGSAGVGPVELGLGMDQLGSSVEITIGPEQIVEPL
jgi:hypothetical protein